MENLISWMQEPINVTLYPQINSPLSPDISKTMALSISYASVASHFPAWMRMLILISFTASYVLKTVHYSLSTLLLRLAESDRAVFTVLFGGLGAIAKSANEVTKLL
jgi:hypothetical protein